MYWTVQEALIIYRLAAVSSPLTSIQSAEPSAHSVRTMQQTKVERSLHLVKGLAAQLSPKRCISRETVAPGPIWTIHYKFRREDKLHNQ